MISKILIYTENHALGGGNRYMMDIINAIPENIAITIASNWLGMTDFDRKMANRPFTHLPIPAICSVQDLKHRLARQSAPSKFHQILSWILQYPIFKIPLFLFIKLRNRFQFSKIIKTIMPDRIIVANGGYPGALSCLDFVESAYRLAIPTYLTIVSMPQSRMALELFYQSMEDKVVQIVVNAEAIRTALIQDRQFAAHKLSVIHNGVSDLPHTPHPDRFLNQFHIPKDSIRIGFIGRLEPLKGIDELLIAFSEINRQYNNCYLLLVGKTVAEYPIRERIKALHIAEKVVMTDFYLGPISDVLDAIHIFAFPSHWEGFPYALLEAMQAGKTIIASAVGGIPEAITNGEEGILIPPQNSGALTQALLTILANPDPFQKLGETAQKRIHTQFNIQQFAQKWVKLLL